MISTGNQKKSLLPDCLLASLLAVMCLIFIYFFHFDVFVTSDSAWTALAEAKLLDVGLRGVLDSSLSHGVSYLFSYYAFYYPLLKFSPLPSLDIMHQLNLFNGFVFAVNIPLLYFLLRLLLKDKILSFFLSLLYFFIPKVFLLALYVNPNALSFLFFLAANITWILYLRGKKMRSSAPSFSF